MCIYIYIFYFFGWKFKLCKNSEKMISTGLNLVMTVIGFSVSTMFIVFVCTRLVCARIHFNASRRSFPVASRSDLGLVSSAFYFFVFMFLLKVLFFILLVLYLLPHLLYSIFLFNCSFLFSVWLVQLFGCTS